jgi:hypothetical protein
MKETITAEELEKASHNVQRLAEFIGERREWTLASDAQEAAQSLAEAAKSMAAVIAKLSKSSEPSRLEVRQPPRREPSGTVTCARLTKFADFIAQLRQWFAAHDGATLPKGSDRVVHSIHSGLVGVIAAVDQLLGLSTEAESGEGPLVSGDLGPVAKVDINAKLVLEDTEERPLVQVIRGVTGFTPETTTMVDEFFAKQGIKLQGAERRRFEDKVLKWIKGMPDGQVLVVRMSGLSGKAEAYSSYRPKKS